MFSPGIAKEGNSARNVLSKGNPDDRKALSVSNSCVGVAALVGKLGSLDRVPLNLSRGPREITYVIRALVLDLTSNFAPTLGYFHVRSESNNSNSKCHDERANKCCTPDQAQL